MTEQSISSENYGGGLFSSKSKSSQRKAFINLQQEAKQTRSPHINYNKCALSVSSLRQQKPFRITAEEVKQKQVEDKKKDQKLNNEPLMFNSRVNRVVSVCFQQEKSPFLSMISSAQVKKTELIQEPQKLSLALINDQHRQLVQQKVIGLQPSHSTQNGSTIFRQKSLQNSRAQSAKSIRTVASNTSKVSTFQNTLAHQSSLNNLTQLKKSMSLISLSRKTNTSSQQSRITGANQQTCLIWNKEAQNLVLSDHSQQRTLSSLYLKENKKIQLQEMIEKKTLVHRPQLTPKLERIVPPDLKRAVEDIERDLAKFYSVYNDVESKQANNKSNSTSESGSIRIQNIDINQKLNGAMKNGNGIGFLPNGDIYSGMWKDGKRDGLGACKFFKDGYYKGDWVNDEMVGMGLRVFIDSFTISGKFVNNGRVVPGTKYQILYTNGEYYEGQISFDKKKHGKGIFFYKNGDFYEGDFVNDRRKGQGRLSMDDGSEYIGQFNDDIAQGEGKFIDANKNKYENSKLGKGLFRNGRLQGKGKAFFINGDVYKGQFKDGSFHGQGKMTYKRIPMGSFYEQEAVYKGEWRHGRKQGFGKMLWQGDASSFKGEWFQDKRVHGIQKMPKDHKIYEGNFKNDLYSGLGKITFLKEKFYFEGIFENGNCPLRGKICYLDQESINLVIETYEGEITEQFEKEGYGKLINKQGDVYEGYFSEDMKQGKGVLKYANWDVYKGEFFRDKKHGYGIFQNEQTKEVFDGQWRDDERNGEGTLFLPNGSERKGTWKGQQIVSKSAVEKPPPLAKNQKSIEQLYGWEKGSKNKLKTERKLISMV